MNERTPTHRPEDWPARLALHPTAFVAPGAVVVGAVTLGARSSVWFNTVVRGDSAPIELGEDSNLQDNTTAHVDEGWPTRIGARVTVGHRTIVHGCTIEDDCLIGMGSIVLTGARIGKGSLIGAGALVREGQEIPPGSLAVGAPARVVGPVSDAHRQAIRNGTEHYVALSRSYLARGFARPHAWSRADTGISSWQRGPMSYLEWSQTLAVLAESLDWAADRLERNDESRWREAPAADRWCALEVLAHLRDADRDVYAPRVERLLQERSTPEFPDIDMTQWHRERGYRGLSPAAVLEEWSEVRRRLIARLAPLPRVDWARMGWHSIRGPLTLAEMVRHWGEHDLAHRRQMAEALGEFA